MELMAAALPALVCCGCFCVLTDARDRAERKKRPVLARLLLFALCLLCGYCRAECERRKAAACQVLEPDGRRICYEGCVETLGRRDGRWEMVLRLQRPGGQEPEANAPERLLVYADAGTEQDEIRPRIGGRVSVRGSIQAFEKARNPGEFDFRDYYRAKKLYFCMWADGWEPLGTSFDRAGDALFAAADYAGDVLDRIADPEAAGIFRAVLLGDRAFLGEDIRELYQRNGISHMLAISGLHLSMVSLAVYGLLRRMGLGFFRAGVFAGALLAAYGMMAGASPSVLRALVMVLCGYLAAYLGRTYDLLSALGLAGFLIFWDSPYMLTQSGAQLSFAAVAGIGGVAPCLEQILENTPAGFRKTAAISCGLQLATAPVLLYHFFQLPLYGMLLNLLTTSFMGIVIASGAAGILAGSVSTAAGRFAAGSGCMILAYYKMLCKTVSRLPRANLVLGRPHPWQIGMYCGLLAAALLTGRRLQKRKAACCILVIPMVLLPLPAPGLQTAFLDVGQGDGICMRAGGTVILVDGGSSDKKTLGKTSLEPFLKSQGITEIDYAVVSHGDQDHISGLKYLMQDGRDISVRHLVLPAAGYGEDIYGELAALAEARGAETIWMGQGDSVRSGRLLIECLYPAGKAPDALRGGSSQDGRSLQEDRLSQEGRLLQEGRSLQDGRLSRDGKTSADRNGHSLVLEVHYGDFRMLLTGDMSADGEETLMRRMAVEPVQVLKIAHHGSRFSTTPSWLDELRPWWAVISYGEGNRYGHPHPEVTGALEERGVVIWETAKNGAVFCRTDGKRIRWETFLPK